MYSPKQRRLAWLAALGSGLLLYSAFPPLAQADAAWFALVPLLIVLRRSGWRLGWRLGWGAGLVFWLGNLAWLWRLVDNQGPLLLVVLGHMSLAAYCALYTGLFGLALGWCWQNSRLATAPWRRLGVVVLLEPLLWVGSEQLRGILFTGFPWNGLGVSQYLNGALIQSASWGGVAAISAMLMAVNGAVAAMVVHTWEDLVGRRRAGFMPQRRIFGLRSVEMVFALSLAVAAWMWGLERLRTMEGVRRTAPRWRVALVHPDAPSIFERDDEAVLESAQTLLSLSGMAAATSPILTIWPETILPGPVPHDAMTMALARRATKGSGGWLLAGGIEESPAERPLPGLPIYDYHNSALLFAPSGHLTNFYRKQHLVPFGEYIPGEGLWPQLARLSPIGYSCRAGRVSTVMEVSAPEDAAKLRLSPLICFEDIMPYLARRAVQGGAELLVNITNDAWFDGSCESEQHLAQAVFRCIESGVPMVRCANRGVSCAIDANGRIARRIGAGRGAGQMGFLCEELPIPSQPPPTPYLRHGTLWLGVPAVLVLLGTLGSLVWSSRHRESKNEA